MRIDTTNPLPPPPGAPQPGTPAALLDAAQEDALRAREGAFLSFGSAQDPLIREAIRDEWGRALAPYLEYGTLSDDAAEGPVYRHADAQLLLREGMRVFGFLDNQGCGDCYYLCCRQQHALMFFTLCIESGNDTDGPYDIYVSAAQDWHTFLAHLPPT
ncbi:hypothetical protein [Stenotrophomonas sp. PS02289]|uniref:hypothetical protein n=1 Tax=Stenotrophomonas sp. PS02289 TaxID=2991422 RepID=UPI00249AC776|nr:hypothetical protein [Stenotrophomonas sp. PS02289]